MGCDIHLHIEIKINNEWHHYNHPQIGRNYDLFTKMASVRNYSDEIDPISKPKGFPEDTSFTTKFDYERWDSDAHSASWLGAKEIKELAEWWAEKYKNEQFPKAWFETTGGGNFGYLFGNSYEHFLEYRGKEGGGYPSELRDVRFVFWFDS